MIGQQINQFKILSKLGQGGMGEVYLALDTKLDRKVALKFLPPHYSQDPDFKARFEHEAKATAALNHPNIITVHDLGEHEGRGYIAMEQVDGQTLEQKIAGGGISMGEAISYAKQICDGLGAAHESGIVHRDVKPANILIDKKSRVKILDFGLAKSRRATTETQVGTTVGTIQYESPEQSRGDKVDGRSDLFSLGVLLFEMVTSKRPFTGEFEDAVRYAIANENPEPMARFKSDVPDDLQRMVTKLLEKDPDLRYQSAAGLMSDLKTLQRDSGPHPSAVHSAVHSGVRPAPQKRAMGRVIIPASVVIVALALLFVFKPWSVDIQPTSEAEAAEDKLAVMYFENLADPEDSQRQASIVSNLLISAFSESEYVKVVSSQRLYDILKNIGYEGERKISPDVATQVAERAHAKWIVTGTIMQSEPTLAISAQLVEVSTGNVMASPTIRGQPGEEIFDVVDRLTAGIRKDLAIPGATGDDAEPSVRTLTTASTDAYGSYLEGVEAARRFRLSEAEEHFRKALEFDSTYAMAHYRLGWMRARRWSDFAGLMEHINEAMKYSSSASAQERMQMRAGYQWFHGELDSARTTYAEIIRLYPEEKESYVLLSRFFRQVPGYGNVDSSIVLLGRVLELDSLDHDAYNQLAYDYDSQGNFEKSIWAINKYIEMLPGEANPLDSRAELYANNGQAKLALESYLQAIALDSTLFTAHDGAFAMHLFLGQYDAARVIADRFLASSDVDRQMRGRRLTGTLAVYRGHFARALELLEPGTDAPRSSAEASAATWRLGGMFIIHKYLGDLVASKEAAERLYRRASLVDSTGIVSAWLMGPLIRQAIAEGDRPLTDSLLAVRHAKVGAQGASQADEDRGVALLEFGSPDSALAYIESWVAGSHDFHESYWLAQAYAKAERLRDAVRLFEGATERFDRSRWEHPIESVRIHFLLARAYEKSGRSDKAVVQYRRFLDLWKDADTETDDIKYAKRRLTQLGA